MATIAEPSAPQREQEEDDLRPSAEDEDTGAQVTPIVRLQEVAMTTGEENDDVLLELKAKLYRFDSNQWKERGAGTVKLLKNKETGKVRLVMRQNRTLKTCANHFVHPTMTLQDHHGNEKSCIWHAPDFADGELKEETFCIRFPSIENCQSFKDKIEEITKTPAEDSRDSKQATAAAELIEKLSVDGKEKEEKAEANEAPSSSKKDDEKDEISGTIAKTV